MLALYGYGLDVTLVEQIAAVRHDEFLDFLTVVRQCHDQWQAGKPSKVILFGQADKRRRFGRRLRALVQSYEAGLGDRPRVPHALQWPDAVPTRGSARLTKEYRMPPEEVARLARELRAAGAIEGR